MKVLVKVLKGKQNLHSYLSQDSGQFREGFPGKQEPSRCFEAICEGVTAVKVFHGIKGEKGFYLMVFIVERKAPGIGIASTACVWKGHPLGG